MKRLYIAAVNRWRRRRGGSISVGHCTTHRGSAVLLSIGRKRAGLTPDGARKVADQLRVWADHAETHGWAIDATVRWIVRVSMPEDDAVVKVATEWMSHATDKAAALADTRPDCG